MFLRRHETHDLFISVSCHRLAASCRPRILSTETEGFEPSCRGLADKRISSAPRYDRFATSPKAAAFLSRQLLSIIHIFSDLCSRKKKFFNSLPQNTRLWRPKFPTQSYSGNCRPASSGPRRDCLKTPSPPPPQESRSS